MKIFVAGSTGVLGRRVVSRLVSLGHEVVGLSRSREGDECLESRGAVARRGDLLDRDGLFDITADCEAIIHLARAIPTKSRTVIDDWVLGDRVRTEGTTNLVEAALRAGCRLYIQPSVTFLYGRRHGEWVDETCPPAQDLPSMVKSTVDMERYVLDAATHRNLPAIILRFGNVYSYDTRDTTSTYDLISVGKFPLIEGGNAYWNLVAADDAAGAVVAAVTTGSENIGKIFNICDDEPVKQKELVGFLASELGAPKPVSLPVFLAKCAIGEHTVEYLLHSVRCMNRRAKEDLGWKLQYPTYREGHEAIMKMWRSAHGHTGTSGARPLSD